MHFNIGLILLAFQQTLRLTSATPAHAGLALGTNLGLVERAPEPTLAELKQTAMAYIKDLATLDNGQHKNRKILVIGGMAVMEKLPRGRSSPDVDLIVNGGKPPAKSLKEMVFNAFPNKYTSGLGGFFYRLSPEKSVGIDFIDENLQPFMVTGLKTVAEVVQSGQLPFISTPDLIVLKALCSPTRNDPQKCLTDAKDALNLVKSVGSVKLDPSQAKHITDDVIANLVKETGETRDWWKEKLGLAKSRSPSPAQGPATPGQATKPGGGKRSIRGRGIDHFARGQT